MNQVVGEEWKGRKRNSGSGGDNGDGSSGEVARESQWNNAFDQQWKEKRKALKTKANVKIERKKAKLWNGNAYLRPMQ